MFDFEYTYFKTLMVERKEIKSKDFLDEKNKLHSLLATDGGKCSGNLLDATVNKFSHPVLIQLHSTKLIQVLF